MPLKDIFGSLYLIIWHKIGLLSKVETVVMMIFTETAHEAISKMIEFWK